MLTENKIVFYSIILGVILFHICKIKYKKMTNEEKRRLVLEGNLYKGLLLLSFPIIFNNIMQTLYQLVDSYFVSQISVDPKYVAAVNGVWPITALIMAIGTGLQIAGTSLMSQHVGANNKEKANYIASQLMSFSLVMGIIMTIVGIIASPIILYLMQVKGDTYTLSITYLTIIFLSTATDFGFMIFISMRQAYGDTATPVILSLISGIINVILNPIFIFDLNMGVAGAAVATVLSKLLIVPIWIMLAFFDKKAIHLKSMVFKWHKNTISMIVRIASSASIGQSINSVGFIVLNAFIYTYGEATMSAFSIGNRINNLIMLPGMGVGSALSFYIGQNIGRENYARAKAALRSSMILTLLLMLVCMAFTLPHSVRLWMVQLFFKDEVTIGLTIEYLLFIGLSSPLMGIYQNFTGVFQGAGKTNYSLLMTISRLWIIRIPVMILLSKVTNLNQTGIWWSMVISNIMVCIIGAILYFRGKWQKRII